MKRTSLFILLFLQIFFATGVWSRTFPVVADTYIDTRDNTPYGSKGTIETRKLTNDDGTERYLYGLIGFEFDIPNDKKVSKATLHLVSERVKSGHTDVSVYLYPSDFNENTTFNVEAATLNTIDWDNVPVSFAPKGENGKAIFDNISDSYKDLAAWTNDINVTPCFNDIKSGTARVNFLLKQDGDQVCFYTKENGGMFRQNTANPEWADGITETDLTPYLEIEYEDNPNITSTTLLPSADTWVMSTAVSHNPGKSASIEIRETANQEGSPRLYGLLSFNNLPDILADASHYRITSARLRLTTTFLKTAREIEIYDYPNFFNEESACYDTEGKYIVQALNSQPVATFEAAGQMGKAFQYDPVDSEYQDVTSWTNYIDLTDYLNGRLQSSTNSQPGFNLMLRKPAENAEATQFASKETADIQLAGTSITFNKEDLLPILEITYEQGEFEMPELPEDKEGTITFGASYYTSIGKDSNDGFSTRQEMPVYNMYGPDEPKRLNTETMALLKFEIPEEVLKKGNYIVNKATLRLVTTELKGDPTVEIYDYVDFQKGTKFASQESNVRNAIASGPIAAFDAIGESGYSMRQGEHLSEATRTVEGWTNYIDLTDYLQDKTGNSNGNNSQINLMLRRRANTDWGVWETISFGTDRASDDIEAWDDGYWNIITKFKAADLVPLLTIEYSTETDGTDIPYYLSFEPVSESEAKVVKCLESSNITEAVVPEKITIDGVGYMVTEVGEKAFYQNKQLKKVILPDCIRTIGSNSFANTSALEEINVPSSLESIKDWAFYGCHASNVMELPEKVTEVGTYAFSSCGFKKIDMSKATGLTKIEDKTFRNIGDAEIILPSELEEIGEEAFYSAGIKTIKLPVTLRKLGDKAFYSSDIQEITIPEGMEELSYYCFGSAKGLQKIILPSTMKRLGDGTWSNCPKIAEVICYAEEPPTGHTNFNDNGNDRFNSVEFMTLSVPHNSYDAYINAQGWSTAFQYFYCIDEYSGESDKNDHIEVIASDGTYIDHEGVYDFKDRITLNFNLHRTYAGYSGLEGKTPGHHFTYSFERLEQSNRISNGQRQADAAATEDVILNPGLNSIEYGEGLDNNQKYRITTTVTSEDGGTMAAHSFTISFADATGIETLSQEEEFDSDAQYFTLQGIKTDNPQKGEIYIKVTNGNTVKIVK